MSKEKPKPMTPQDVASRLAYECPMATDYAFDGEDEVAVSIVDSKELEKRILEALRDARRRAFLEAERICRSWDYPDAAGEIERLRRSEE